MLFFPEREPGARDLLIIGDYDRTAIQRSKMSCLYCRGDNLAKAPSAKSDTALRCRSNRECASGRFQQAWLGGRQSDSWSSMVSCLTHSTMCSSGQLVALLPPKTCMASRTPGGRGFHLRAEGLVMLTLGYGWFWGVRRLQGLWPF